MYWLENMWLRDTFVKPLTCICLLLFTQQIRIMHTCLHILWQSLAEIFAGSPLLTGPMRFQAILTWLYCNVFSAIPMPNFYTAKYLKVKSWINTHHKSDSVSSIISTALMGTSLIFISFTFASLYNTDRKFLYMGGKWDWREVTVQCYTFRVWNCQQRIFRVIPFFPF